MNDAHGSRLRQIALLLLTIGIALAFGLLVLGIDGHHPLDALQAGYQGALASPQRAANTLARITIIALLGLAAAVPFSAGMWNIGGEGQLVVGAFTAALVGINVASLPSLPAVSLSLAGAVLAGMIWAAMPALLKLRFRADEIVTTIMFNYLALLLTEYLVNYPLRAPGSSRAETVVMPAGAQLPTLVPLSMLNAGLFVTAAAVLLVYAVMRHTVMGYEWRVVGANREFARYGGVRVERVQLGSMLAGGGLAGLAGAILVLGVHHRFILNISGGMAFTGVLIALIAANSPLLVVALAGVFGLLLSATLGMESKLGIPVELGDIVASAIILLIIAREPVARLLARLPGWREARG